MELLDTLTVYHDAETRTIELYHGDLTDMKPEEAVDILVVSAFPDNYVPLPTTLVGALYDKGISVAELAATKAVDLRQTCSCWLSQEIESKIPGIQFKRILCFEPLVRGQPSQVVGDIFRSLVPFLSSDSPNSVVAMPLVASGRQGAPASDILTALLDASVHWMALGLPLKCLKIVECSSEKAAQLKQEFFHLKGKYKTSTLESNPGFKYDVFISYSRKDSEKVLLIVKELKKRKPSLRIFMDEQELYAGAAWQQEIYEALDACRKVIAVYSPSYLLSKVCQEEFNIALYRHRDAKDPILFPMMLYDTELPTYMKLLQYVDCKCGNEESIQAACAHFLLSLNN